jgi:hypothetical protein
MDFCSTAIKYKPLPLFCFPERNGCSWRRAAVFVIKYNILNLYDSSILLTNNEFDTLQGIAGCGLHMSDLE